MTKPTSMTELQAVNVLLTTIGESPVNTLTGNQVTDVTIANQVITEVSREVQAQGWHFNTEDKVVLSRDVANNIIIPSDVARIDTPNFNTTIRGGKLFNLTDRTYVFSSSVEASIVYFQDFAVLPEVVKNYISTRASRIFSDRMLNSETIHKMVSRDEQKALTDLKAFESDTADFNMMDSYAVARVMKRGFNRRMLS